MGRGEKQPEAAAAVATMTAGLERAITLELPTAGPPAALVGSLFDTLVVYEEAGIAEPTGGTPLLSAGQGRSGMTLADWLAPPPKRPRRIVLPGLTTAMGGGLLSTPARAGEELFLATTDLLAAGATTALVSRWRTGGGVSGELVREFLQETTGPGGIPAAEAWQRAVEIVTPERPDLEREPRLKPAAGADLADARHPLFWAGFMLIDLGGGVSEQRADDRVPPPPPLAPGPPLPVLAPGGPAAPPAGGPMPPAILEPPPPPPRPEP
jgi:hypothetical protein